MKNEIPKISVLMPVYNGEKFLREAIESVLNQSYKDFEFLILDDGSTDNSIKISESFSDPRIKIIKLNHSGIVKALNEGLKLSKGEYIVRADADDISLPQRFEKLLKFMEENKDTAVCGSWATSINEREEYIGEMNYPPVNAKEIKNYALLHNPFIHPSVIICKEALGEIGGYRNFKHNEDYELWTRILYKYNGHNLPEPLLKYRIHQNQITKKKNFEMRIYGFFVRILALLRLFFKP